jgi:integrase
VTFLPVLTPSFPRCRMAKLTKRVIDALRPDAQGRDLFVWDGELRGFGVRMKPSGTASFVIQYRTPQGRSRRLAIGKTGTLTPEQARVSARRLLAEAAEGGDPAADRHEARKAITVADLCERYLEAAAAGLVMTRFRKPKRPSTIAIDNGRVARHIVPLIGDTVAQNLNRAAVQRMVDAIAAGKTAGTFKTKIRGKAVIGGGAGAAARVAELLGGIWTWAEKRGLVSGPNPVRGVETQRSDAKDRVLSPDELARLGAVLQDKKTTRQATAAVRLIALTGLRREEACGLRWREIDFAANCLRLEATKTGRSMRPIGKAALQLLAALPRYDEWVFPNRDGSGSADLKKAIATLFDEAGLADARSHALRRTFASFAADEGYGDATIGELLGHARRGVTARHYIRRPDAALIAAADRVSQSVAAIMAGKSGDVIALNKDASSVLAGARDG